MIKSYFIKNKETIKNIVIIIMTILTLAFFTTTCLYASRSKQSIDIPNSTDSEENNIDDSKGTKDNIEANNIVGITSDGSEIYANSSIPFQDFAFSCSETSTNKSVTLNATVLPEDATDKSLTWSVRWNNPQSTFATDKIATDYISVSPSGDSMSCTVTYIKDFSEPIYVVASSVSTSGAKGEVKVDCLQKLVNMSAKFGTQPYDSNYETYNPVEESTTIGWDITKLEALETYPATVKDYASVIVYDFGVGNYTVADPYINLDNLTFDVELSLTNEFKQALTTAGVPITQEVCNLVMTYDKELSESFGNVGVDLNGKNYKYATSISSENLYSYFGPKFNKANVRNVILNNGGIKHLNITVKTRSTIIPQTLSIGTVNINPDMYKIPVTSIALAGQNNKDTVLF